MGKGEYTEKFKEVGGLTAEGNKALIETFGLNAADNKVSAAPVTTSKIGGMKR